MRAIHDLNILAALCRGNLLRWDVVNPAERMVEVRLGALADAAELRPLMALGIQLPPLIYSICRRLRRPNNFPISHSACGNSS